MAAMLHVDLVVLLWEPKGVRRSSAPLPSLLFAHIEAVFLSSAQDSSNMAVPYRLKPQFKRSSQNTGPARDLLARRRIFMFPAGIKKKSKAAVAL